MKVTYNSHVIIASQGVGGWITTIDGVESGIEPSKYKRVAIRRAVQALREQERMTLKEIMR